MLRVLTAVATLSVIGCSGSGATDGIGSTELAIYGGTESGPEDDFVVRLQTLDSFGHSVDCSGVAVAPRLVLTARHCLVFTHPPPFQCGADGELVSNGDGGSFGAALDPTTAKVFVGPGYPLDVAAHGTRTFATETTSVCRDDLAFLLLDADLSVPPVPIRLLDGVRVGELVSVIGYGAGYPLEGKQYRKRVSGVTVEAVGADAVDPNDDSATPPRSFALGRSSCGGDSGGPAVSEETGAVLGVSSLSSDACQLETVRNFFPRVAPHGELVKEAFAAAGAEPWIEGAAPPGSKQACTDCESSGSCSVANPYRMAPAGWLGLMVVALGLITRRARRNASPARARR